MVDNDLKKGLLEINQRGKYKGITLRSFLIMISFVESVYIAFQPAPRDGLEFMWVIPFVFGLALIIFGNIIEYHKGGVGFKVFYSIEIMRYLIQPYLILISNGTLTANRMPNAEPESYEFSILIYCIELLMTCIAIKKWYPRYSRKSEVVQTVTKSNHGKLRASGTIAIFFCVCILIYRLPIWYPAMNILGLKEASSNTSILLEATLINCIKALIFVNFLRLTKDSIKYSKNYYLFLIMAIITGILNFIIYFGSNRSFIVESAIATIAIIIFSFPEYRKRILTVTLPVAAIIIISMFVKKQFGLDNANDFSSSTVSLGDISNIIEEYVNGFWTVARSYQASLDLTVTQSTYALIKDITEGLLVVFDIPGLGGILSSTEGLQSSSDLMKNTLGSIDRGQMLSFSGGMLIVGGKLLGWVFVFIGNYFGVKILTRFEARSKIEPNYFYKYMHIWMSVLFGLIHCYALQTLIYSWSKFILFYWFILWVNKMVLRSSSDFVVTTKYRS